MGSPVLRIAQGIYRFLSARKLIAGLVEFHNSRSAGSKLSYADAVCLYKASYWLNNDLWNTLQPQTEQEIRRFYELTPWYPFELVYWHTDPQQRKFRSRVAKLARGTVLDYGGGIGDLSLALARRELEVTYAEVKGRNMEFAQWLFQKSRAPVKVLDLSIENDDLAEEYDTIICIDVIEHTPSPRQTLEHLASHLKADGRMIITQLGLTSTDGNPQHIPLDFNAEALMNSLGLVKDQRWPWLWTRLPAEGIEEKV